MRRFPELRTVRLSLVSAVLGVLAALCATVHAQDYPLRPIRMVVPFPAGNSLDVRARQLAVHMPPLLGQPIIVDNQGGASGIIGTAAVARAKPDGYTILLSSAGPLVFLPRLKANLPYDPKDLEPVTLLATTPMMLVVPNGSPARSLRELINLANASPGKLNYASQGIGSINHLATELFARLAGVRLTHVPYNAYNQAIPDLIKGEVALLIDGPPVILPQVQAGNLRALAVNSGARLGPVPEVPTFEEAGLPGFWPGPWYGVVVPKGTPPAVIDRLRNAFGTALKAADVVRTADEQGQTLIGSSPAEFRTFIQTEQERYRSLIQETGIRLE